MEKNKNTSNKMFFDLYHETRTQFLDISDKDKLDWFSFYYKEVYESYISHKSKNSSILDLGCNKGYLLKTLKDEGFTNLTGVDLSVQDIKIAEKIIPEAHLVVDDIYHFLKTTEQYFDIIFLKAVIEHLEKNRVVELLQLISQRLSPKGFVIIDVYNADWLFSNHDRYMDFTHETGFTKDSLRQVMLFAFKIVEVSTIASPINFKAYNASRLSSFKESIRYLIMRKIIKFCIESIEPEMKEIPFMDRLLLGVGKNE